MEYKNMPQQVKEYFEKGSKKIVKVIPREDYSLIIYFDNNEIKIYDMSESLYGVFEVLKNKDKFKEVFIDEYGNIAWDIDNNIDSNVYWNNRIDICKDSIYMDSVLYK
jgi:predicted ribosome-associated RNA-binding protein Tma20